VSAPALAAPGPGSDAAIRASAKARLAEAGGDARTALDALTEVASAAPEQVGLSARMLDQALIAGDLRRATEAAQRLWQRGDQRFDARLVLLVDAVKRADWRTARSYADQSAGKAGIDLTARLITPVVLGWIDVAAREAAPDRHLARLGRIGADPTPQWIAASMLLLSGQQEAAERRAASLAPSNRTSQIVAARLAASFDKRGAGASANAIRAQISAAIGAANNPLAGLDVRPVGDARQGIGQWFALLGDGFARTPNGSSELALLFTRAANWLDPADGFAQLALAEALIGSKQPDTALGLLERSAQGQQPAGPFALRRAELLSERGEHDAAVQSALPRGTALPQDAAWLIRFADVARAARDDAMMGAVFDQLLPLLPENDALRAAVLIAKAELLLRQQRWEEARPLLEAALAASPDDAGTLNYVGYSALERRDNIPLALRRIEAAWDKDRRNAAITDSLGWAYLITGDVERAVPLLETAARGEPANAVINEHLGDALWKSGRKIEARYQWRVAALFAEPDMAARLATKMTDGLTDATLAP
jgi:tetratricopeptide (TPR) repeat protein